jgi:hypothetical protein
MLTQHHRLTSMRTGGEDMDLHHFREPEQAIQDTGDKGSIGCQGPIKIEHGMVEFDHSPPWNVQSYHYDAFLPEKSFQTAGDRPV